MMPRRWRTGERPAPGGDGAVRKVLATSASTETIDRIAITHLVEAGAVVGAEVIGQSGGWGVVITYGTLRRALAGRNGALRIFKKFETLVGYLKELGIIEYRVDAARYDPAPLTGHRARPDAAMRMKRAHEVVRAEFARRHREVPRDRDAK